MDWTDVRLKSTQQEVCNAFERKKIAGWFNTLREKLRLKFKIWPDKMRYGLSFPLN